MLLNEIQIYKAMQLNADDVTNALRQAGYTDDKAITAAFTGLTPNRRFAYAISFMNDGDIDCGICYVEYNKDGVLVAEY